MTDNTIKGGLDSRAWVESFEQFTPVQRRWAFLSVKMAEHHKTFVDIARRHKMSAWYLGACAQGKPGYNMGPRVIKALQADLNIDLAPFLDPIEAGRMRLAACAKKPKEEKL